jgi:hypothetical protein
VDGAFVPAAVIAAIRAERALRNIWPRSRGSLRLDAGRPDHLGPLLGFVRDELAEVGGGTGKNRTAQIAEPSLYLGVGEAGIGLLVELRPAGAVTAEHRNRRVRDTILAATNKCLAKNNKSPDRRGATIEAKPPMEGYRPQRNRDPQPQSAK